MTAGYAGLFAGKTDVRVFKVLSQKKIVPEDAIALLLFLFHDYEDFQKAALKVQTDDTGTLAELFPDTSCIPWITGLQNWSVGNAGSGSISILMLFSLVPDVQNVTGKRIRMRCFSASFI